MSQNSSEIEPCPLTCHGLGPSSSPLTRTENRPAPNTLTDSDAEISISKRNGENWNSASNERLPLTFSSSRPHIMSTRAPNWTVLVVTAK